MIFLIEYDRSRGEIISLENFDDKDWQRAEETCFEKELSLNHAGIEHEVVLLEAVSEEALRRTHRRYFENIEQLSTMP